jgi:rsbT antagonist protein RsbS
VEPANATHIPLQLTSGSIVASIQVDMSDDVMLQFREDLLALLKTSGAGRIILDLSGVAVMDLAEFESLRRTVFMAELMGARSVLAGLRPGVVSSLVELDAPLDWIEAALNLEQAFGLLSEAAQYPEALAMPEVLTEQLGVPEEQEDEPPAA